MSHNFFYKQDTLPQLTEEQLPPMPSQIGPYKIESMINKGGMSILYLGVHPQKNQLLAIKTLSPHFVSDAAAVDRFLKEAHIISLSNHPNIVKLYGEGKWENGLYIAMEWIRGISLRQFIMQQSLSIRRALDIILQVSYALHHLHSHGIVHRDLKPENILITEEGGIKVIDFGIAQIHSEKSQSKKELLGVMGTPNYMSPEQKEDVSKASFASDIYALGIISYELILGKLSFGHIQLSLLPKGIKKIIEKALAVSIAERYQNISGFINDISNYLTSGEIDKERPGGDQIKEVIESFQKTSSSLNYIHTQNWSQLELGVSKHTLATQFGLYYDVIRLPNGAFLFVISEANHSSLDSIAYMANFRGLFRGLIYQYIQDSRMRWDLAKISDVLNSIITEDSSNQTYAFNALLLDPTNDELFFLSAGQNPLIHMPSEGKARTLNSNHPLLGQDKNAIFTQVSDNWNIGDVIIFHNLAPSFRSELFQQQQTERILLEATNDEAFLSAQPQAESIMKKALTLSFQKEQKQSKVILSIQRIS